MDLLDQYTQSLNCIASAMAGFDNQSKIASLMHHVGVLPSGSPRGIPRKVVVGRDSPRLERDGARNTKI